MRHRERKKRVVKKKREWGKKKEQGNNNIYIYIFFFIYCLFCMIGNLRPSNTGEDYACRTGSFFRAFVLPIFDIGYKWFSHSLQVHGCAEGRSPSSACSWGATKPYRFYLTCSVSWNEGHMLRRSLLFSPFWNMSVRIKKIMRINVYVKKKKSVIWSWMSFFFLFGMIMIMLYIKRMIHFTWRAYPLLTLHSR